MRTAGSLTNRWGGPDWHLSSTRLFVPAQPRLRQGLFTPKSEDPEKQLLQCAVHLRDSGGQIACQKFAHNIVVERLVNRAEVRSPEVSAGKKLTLGFLGDEGEFLAGHHLLNDAHKI